jgi:hypothetical protein
MKVLVTKAHPHPQYNAAKQGFVEVGGTIYPECDPTFE